MSLTDQLLAQNTVKLDSKIPAGPMADKWNSYKDDMKLVNPNNKRKFKVIVVGTGLAGASAAATLAELGYQVDAFTFHDSARRAHSIAAQGGINGAKTMVGAHGDETVKNVYNAVVYSFQRTPVALFYVLANVLLGLHLFHGAWSIFQSFGWNNPRFNKWRRAFATGFAAIVVVGNVSFPVAVMAGILK